MTANKSIGKSELERLCQNWDVQKLIYLWDLGIVFGKKGMSLGVLKQYLNYFCFVLLFYFFLYMNR